MKADKQDLGRFNKSNSSSSREEKWYLEERKKKQKKKPPREGPENLQRKLPGDGLRTSEENSQREGPSTSLQHWFRAVMVLKRDGDAHLAGKKRDEGK